MKWICVVALALTACATPARAVCPAPPGAVDVALPSGLPSALRDKMGNIALPGEPFNAIDIYIKGLPHRRYIFVWNIDDRWIVATEQGGIALRTVIFAYDLGKDGKTATLIDKRLTSPTNVCGLATKLAGR